MTIQIEKSIGDLNYIPKIFKIVELIEDSKTLIQAIDILKSSNVFDEVLKFGTGGYHIWVAYRTKRILLITE